MRIVRALLIVIFGLLSTMAASNIWRAPSSNAGLSWSALALFICIILVLGPLWPTQTKLRRLAALLDRVTGIPNATPVVANLLASVYALYRVFDTYAHPDREYARVERGVARYFGANGVIIFWLIVCGGCLIYAYRFYKASMNAKQRPNP